MNLLQTNMIVNDYSSDNSLNFHNIKYFEQNLKDDLVLSKKTKTIKVYIVIFLNWILL